MVQYKLTYFNGRGLAEFARYVFAAAGQDYEDSRFEFEAWPAIKPTTPLGQAPFLEVIDGSNVEQISQSNTIARFLANRFGLAGKDDLEKAKADMIVDQITDMAQAYRVAFYLEPNEDLKKEKVAKFYSETVPQHLEILEKLFEKRNTEFSAGNEMTYADLAISATLDRFREHITVHIEKFPRVKSIDDKVNAHPKIAEWRAKRPVTPF